jgi:hypothetical protein
MLLLPALNIGPGPLEISVIRGARRVPFNDDVVQSMPVPREVVRN